MRRGEGQRRNPFLPGLMLAAALVEPSLTFSFESAPLPQYAHSSWTVRDGYQLGLVFAITQTPDGYLWLGSDRGLFRFDGVRFSRWLPPAGQELPDYPYALLVSRAGTLWIGTFGGLASWDGSKLTDYPELKGGFVTSLIEDHEGTVWAGVLGKEGRLCAIRAGRAQCDKPEVGFGQFVWSLVEDDDGVLWAGAESGLWRWRPGPPRRYDAHGRLADLITTTDGQLLVGMRGGGLKRLADEKIQAFAIRNAANPREVLADSSVKTNKLLRDREGGIWIGTDGLGLIHVKDGKAEGVARSSGLSGNIACALFEDREGNIWFSSDKGLDRFRKQFISTLSVQSDETTDVTKSVLAAADGSMWVSTFDGITRWKDGLPARIGQQSPLLDGGGQSLFQDSAGRIWVSTYGGLAYLQEDALVPVAGQPGNEVASMSGDEAGNLWLSGPRGLAHFHGDKHLATVPWSQLGRRQQAKVLIADHGGVWMSFWQDGGVLFFKDGAVRAAFDSRMGLGAGHVSGLRLDSQHALWAATEEGGLSRIKDGRVQTLTTRNGLPCNAIHWSTEDTQGNTWLYAACGLLRVLRDDLDAWVADPSHAVKVNRWGASDGIPIRPVTPAYFNPPVAKAPDGKLWMVAGEGVQVIDPQNLPFNAIPPPVYVEQVAADRNPYAVAEGLRLPPLVRDVTIAFTAVSLSDPQDVQFRYRLEGHDAEWQEAGNRRQAYYTNLSPGSYRFLVTASNNSGVWNEKGAQLAFSIAPAFYQTAWFRLACVALLLAIAWGALQMRTRRLRREERRLREVFKGIPTMAFSTNPDGSPDLVNQRWLDYTGLPSGRDDAPGWETTVHPADIDTHLAKWRIALATGQPFENEARHRSATGEYRWFLVRAVPLRDKQAKITKWYGALTDIEELKRADAERERLRRLEAQLAHTNRLSMLGELTASLAHEINQPIAATIASAGACLRWLDRKQPELDRAREAVARIKEDGKRAADIIEGLKAFYRKGGSQQRVLLDINDVVREMLVLLHREPERHSVVLRTDLAEKLPPVYADRVQLQQVLMNLMVNGIEAMGAAGGEMWIRTRATASGVEVSVSDTGAGIAPDQLEVIFNPFVTTKATGTGMGLAISRTIIESHDGRLWAETNTDRGASFRFTLPAAAADSAATG